MLPRLLQSALLAGLLACQPDPTPVTVAPAVLAGDLDRARGALNDASEQAELHRWTRILDQLESLEPTRRALHEAERNMLSNAVEQALEADNFGGVAAPLSAGLAAWPEDPRFLELQRRLEARAEALPPADAVAAWGALARSWEHDAERRARFLRAHRRTLLHHRYSADQRARTLAALDGVTLDAVNHLLQRVDRAYYVQPDWTQLTEAGREHVVWLQEAPGAREQWPALADVRWPPLPDASTAPRGVDGAIDWLRSARSLTAQAGVPIEVLLDTWIGGALSALDPWTRAVWPAEMAAWEAHHAGVSYGVGLELAPAPGGGVRVARPLPDSPSWSADIHQDDVLMRISDESGSLDLGADATAAPPLSQLSPEERVTLAEDALAGQPDSSVALLLQRGDADPHEVHLNRGPVRMQTVTGFRRAADNRWLPWLSQDAGLAYLRITRFREHSEPAVDALIEAALADDPDLRGLLLDLRGNPGGDVNAAVQIADRFVEDGILAELQGRVEPETGPDVDPQTGQQLVPWNHAIPGHALEGLPLVVLVDRDTSSAAEILAGSLQERAGAIVLGAPTWGKGLAQALRAEPELGYGVQFSNQVWTLPSGRRLYREVEGGGGIQPDITAELSPGESFSAKLLARRRGALRTHADGTPMRPVSLDRKEELPELPADPMLLQGELVLRALIASRDAAP